LFLVPVPVLVLNTQNNCQKETTRIAGDDAGAGVTLGAAGEITFVENIIA
jgi:hypothetical protein